MKIWRAILILTCFSILFFAPQISYGQAVQPCDTAETIGTTYPCRDSQGRSWGSFAERQNAMNAAGAAEMAKKNESKPTGRVQVCPAAAYEKFSLANLASVGILPALCGIVDFTLSGIGWALAGLMYLCATLFDYSFDNFVLHIATMFQDEDGVNKAYIYGAWTAIRDLANIAAFFAAAYAGFLRIIGQNQEDFRKAVAKLLLFALLTNFSFALSKFAIDVSNVISLQIYGAASGYKFSGNVSTSSQGMLSSDYGISTAYMKQMGISAFVQDTSQVNPNSAFKNLDSLTVVFVSYIFFIFAGWQFLSMAIFILTRSFFLIASVIFSPLMFIGGLVPALDKAHDKWRETFFGNLVVAPILAIFTWLGLQILKGANETTLGIIGDGSIQDMLKQIAMLALTGISLYVGKKFAEQASGAVGQFAVKVLGGAVGGAAMAVGTAGTGFIARAGMARAAAMAGNVGKKWATQEGAGRAKKFAGGLLLKGGERMEKTQIFGRSAYDVRKGIEDKVADRRNTVLRENRVAARSLGWTDRLEQAKTADEVAYMEQQIKRGTTYSKDTHDAEMAALKNKPIQRASASELRVLDKDLNKARDLDEKIKIKDSTVATQIQTGQKALDDEYGDIIKTRTEYLENQKRGNATAEERKKTEDYIAATRKTLADKKAELEKQLTEQKNSDTYYQDLQNQLKDLQDAYSKTTTAYKLGSAVGVMNETQRQAGEQDLAAIKGAISTLGSIKPFTTEFDQPNMAPGQVTNFQNIQKSSGGEPFNTLTPKQADSIASKLRGFKKAKQ